MRTITAVIAVALLAAVLPVATPAAGQSVVWKTQPANYSWPNYLDEDMTIFTTLVVSSYFTGYAQLTAVPTRGGGAPLWELGVDCDMSLATGSIFRLSPTTLGVLCQAVPSGDSSASNMLYVVNSTNGTAIRQVQVPSLGLYLPVAAAGAVCMQPGTFDPTPPWCVLSSGAVFTFPRPYSGCAVDAQYVHLYAYNTTLAATTSSCGMGSMSFFDLMSGALLGNVTSAPFLPASVQPATLTHTVRQDGRYLTSLVRPSAVGVYAAVLVVDLQLRTGATVQLSVPDALWPSVSPTSMNTFVAGYNAATRSVVVGITGQQNSSAPQQSLWLWSVANPGQRGAQPAAAGLKYAVALPGAASWGTAMKCQLGGESSLLVCADPQLVSTTTEAVGACPLEGPVAVLRISDGSTAYSADRASVAYPSLSTTLPNGIIVTGAYEEYQRHCVSTYNATTGQPLWSTAGFVVGPGPIWSAPGCVPVGRDTGLQPSVACIASSNSP